MKTLLFTLEYPPFRGGIANYYGNLVKYWPEPREIFVLDNNEGKLIRQPADWLWPKWLPAAWQLKKEIKKNKINYVLVGHILPLGTVAWLLSKTVNFKYSVILHGLDFTFACRSLRKRWLTKRILERAENIICANSYVAKLVGDFLDDKREIAVVNPGIDVQITRNMQDKTEIKEKYNLENKFVLLTVGRLVKRKGVDMVLKSLPKVLKEIPNLLYVILGNGPELENIKNYVSKLKLEKNALVIDNAGDGERNVWYELCDIFIMPARIIRAATRLDSARQANGTHPDEKMYGNDFEGFGIVYLEANLAGKPVIAGNSGGVGDAVKDGINGLLVNPESKEEIAGAIIKLTRDENLRKKLGRQGRQRAIKEFNWEKQVKKIFSFIKD